MEGKHVPYGYCHCGCGHKTNIAQKTASRYGHVKGHHMRFITGHNSAANHVFYDNIYDRFWSRIAIKGPDDCWEWIAARCSHGYGSCSIRGLDRSAHRNAWKFVHGGINGGLLVLHKCDNPPCCNPNHLFLGTHSDNMKDMVKKGRNKSCIGKTLRYPNAKLDEDKALEIKIKCKERKLRYKEIATQYGVSTRTIENIAQGVCWNR